VKIFDFKVSEIKNEGKFIELANILIRKEMYQEGVSMSQLASMGYQLEGDSNSLIKKFDAMLHLRKDVCD
jgi:hypothetical protein